MRPADDRIGRVLANGQFEVIEWLGTSEWMGVATARDRVTSKIVRVTVSAETAVDLPELRSTLIRDIPGFAPIVYLGPVQSDDGWGTGSVLMAEELPATSSLANVDAPNRENDVARLGLALIARLREAHTRAAAIMTLRPEGIFPEGDRSVVLVVRGERLWYMPKPRTSRPAAVPPWPSGYVAPELIVRMPITDEPPPSADVFSLGVLLSERLLGAFPFERQSLTALFKAQWAGDHLPLPATRLGAMMGRAIAPDPTSRPTLDEIEEALIAAAQI